MFWGNCSLTFSKQKCVWVIVRDPSPREVLWGNCLIFQCTARAEIAKSTTVGQQRIQWFMMVVMPRRRGRRAADCGGFRLAAWRECRRFALIWPSARRAGAGIKINYGRTAIDSMVYDGYDAETKGETGLTLRGRSLGCVTPRPVDEAGGGRIGQVAGSRGCVTPPRSQAPGGVWGIAGRGVGHRRAECRPSGPAMPRSGPTKLAD